MLHPEARALLDLLVANRVPEIHKVPPREARAAYRERRAVLQPLPQEVAEVRDLVADGPSGAIPLRLYRPLRPIDAAVAQPVLVYFHGGGGVIGDLDTHDVLCREIANASGVTLIAVDYRLGPEHRYPGAFDDCLAATRWISANAASLGVDATRLAVGGDSAGGNLAAAVCLAVRDGVAGPTVPIAFQLLIYPGTDMRAGHASHRTNGQGYLLTRDTIAYFYSHYFDDPAQYTEWQASPLLHGNHAGLPRALIVTAGYDPLRDEGLDYARVLADAGTRVSYVCFERQIHGFITMGKVLDEANTAVALCATELARALRR